MIELRDVHRIYKKGPHILCGFSMRIDPGSRIAILGTEGSGKSSLLRLIAGIDRPQRGTVRRGLQTSWIVPNYSFFSHYGTGAANVRFIARYYGMDEEAYLRAVIDMSEMGDQINMKLDKIPLPMKGQLAISMALCMDTDVYLFDDAVGVGPTPFRHKCDHAIQALIGRGKAVVIAASAASNVIPFCNEAYCIDGGIGVHYTDMDDGLAHLDLLVAEKKSEKKKTG